MQKSMCTLLTWLTLTSSSFTPYMYIYIQKFLEKTTVEFNDFFFMHILNTNKLYKDIDRQLSLYQIKYYT